MTVDIYKFHRITLRIFGVTFPGDIERRWLQRLVDLYLAMNQCWAIFWALLYFRGTILYTFDDFENRVVGVTAGISVIGSVSKYVTFRLRGGELLHLMSILGRDITDTPQGKAVDKVNRFYTFSVMMIIATHNVHPLYEPFHRTVPYYTRLEGGPPEEVLPDFLLSLWAAFIVLLGNVMGDTLFLTMCCQLCHQVHLLGNTLSSVGIPRNLQRRDIMELGKEVDDQQLIKLCVDEHNRLLRLKEKLVDYFRVIILAQLFYSFCDTCFTLFAVTQDENMVQATKNLLPQFVSLFLEIFLYCWGGEMVHNAFEELHHKSYFSDWYNIPRNIQTSLVIIQANTQKPVNISAAIFDFNFKFYETLCREALSYYTVMYQFFSQK